ncbi:tap42-like protein [Malassezia pachydermatis]|uniref:Tap42-like protein n=1 Tax=Malassezia pachydermatis TaxID=77020 RepID=A0A0M9VNU3_9BASI|nr:tap42-like protein [Malassezia pachydermatis]KOS13675.1 tap42-like protein [Malassezia pachydermatis]
MADDSSPTSFTSELEAVCRVASQSQKQTEALERLRRVAHAADALGIVSDNDRLDEISTPSLRVFFIASLQAQLASSAPVTSTDDRMRARKAQVEASCGAARLFFSVARRHKALPASVMALLRTSVEGESRPMAPAEKRHYKIQTYKLEKQVQTQLQASRQALRDKAKVTTTGPSDVFYDMLVLTMDQDDEEDVVPDDIVSTTLDVKMPSTVRAYLLLLLVLHALRTASVLESGTQELELLQAAPSMPDTHDAATHGAAEEWRIDAPSRWFASTGPLLSEQGKPLRPFVITPASDKRAQLQSEVFRPSHRLPTMSIDEYLAEEARRGNIIGASDKNEATPREKRAEQAEMDGTQAAEEAEEEARQEAIRWDTFKEQHRRGEGNTMNRG